MGSEEQEAATEQALQACVAASGGGGGGIEEGQLAGWQGQQDGGASSSGQGAVILHKFPIKNVAWHARGDYFATVAPTGNTQVFAERGCCCGRAAAEGQLALHAACGVAARAP